MAWFWAPGDVYFKQITALVVKRFEKGTIYKMNKELYQKQLQAIFDLIEYCYLMTGEDNIFYFKAESALKLSIEDVCVMLKLIEKKFPSHVQILNIYDFVNEEHWLPVPPQEYPSPRPIAELKILKNFKDFSKAFKSSFFNDNTPQLIAGKESKYDPETCTLFIGNHPIKLPFDSLESETVEILSHHKVGAYVDWSIIHEKITGNDSFTKDDKRIIRDAARRVNNKIKAIFMTTEEYLSREENGVCRNL